jgi:hypothetical protein
VNHWGDGKIRAFDVVIDSMDTAPVPRQGFPLRCHGRVARSPQTTDIEGDGKLDLVALDEAGYIDTSDGRGARGEGLRGGIDGLPWNGGQYD